MADPEVGTTTSDGWTTGNAAAYQQRYIYYLCGGGWVGAAISNCFPDVLIGGVEWRYPIEPTYEWIAYLNIDL